MKTAKKLTVASAFALAACSTVPAKQSSIKDLDRAKGIYSFESDASGFNTKTHYYDNGEQVVVFDTQFTPEIAKKLVASIRSKTSSPITHVVLTHPNPDKFNGVSVFKEHGVSVFKELGARIIASTKTAEALPGVHEYKKYYFTKIANTYPALATVDHTFADTYELQLNNGERINIHELPYPGVSSNQTVAYIPAMNTLVVGDLVHHKAHAWLEGGILDGQPKPDLSGWIKDLKVLKATYQDRNPLIYGGRGEVAALKTALPQQISYLQTADQLVETYIAAVTNIAELQGEQAQGHYQKIQLQFEQAFPDYSLPYMITYGVYCLVNQKLQKE